MEELYQRGLDRAADEGGLEFWGGLLEDGTLSRGEVAGLFAASDEAEALFDYVAMTGEPDLG